MAKKEDRRILRVFRFKMIDRAIFTDHHPFCMSVHIYVGLLEKLKKAFILMVIRKGIISMGYGSEGDCFT